MSLPISQATLILGATLAAKNAIGQVAGKIVDATRFDDVLRSTMDPPAEAGAKTALTDQTIAAIRDRFSQAGIDTSEPIELAVTSGGRVQVVGDHEQAAQIDALLAADDELVQLASRLHAAAGPVRLTVRASSVPGPPAFARR